MRQVTMDKFGNVISTVDERVFYTIVQERLAYIREQAKEDILAAAPEYKQSNAALGLLSAEETQDIKDAIQEVRTKSNTKEAQILSITWDGQESSRVAACDAVDAIVW